MIPASWRSWWSQLHPFDVLCVGAGTLCTLILVPLIAQLVCHQLIMTTERKQFYTDYRDWTRAQDDTRHTIADLQEQLTALKWFLHLQRHPTERRKWTTPHPWPTQHGWPPRSSSTHN